MANPLICGRKTGYSFLLSLLLLIFQHSLGCERSIHAFETSSQDESSTPKNTVAQSFENINFDEFECLNFTREFESSNNNHNWKHFGTKTTYLNARQLVEKSNTTWPIPETCRPTYLHFLNRHSIRYPSKKHIREFHEKLPALQKHIIETHLHDDPVLVKDFVAWKLLMVENDDNRVTASGSYQSAVTALIFSQYFPELLNIERSKLVIGVTPKIRTSQTADAFVRSLVESQLNRNNANSSPIESFGDFQKKVNEKMSSLPFVYQDVLMSHRTCKSKLEEQHKGTIKKMLAERMSQVLKSSAMASMLERFSVRHHFKETITADILFLMHRVCAFESAIYDNSPWCKLFTENELKLITYIIDYQEYFESYGLPVYRRLGCSFINHLINGIDSYLSQPSGSRDPTAILDFSHENLLSRIVSHFALYDHFPEMFAAEDDHVCIPYKHQYQTSLLLSFGTNFAWTLYECSSSDSGNVEHKILTLHNERPVKLNGCDGVLCDLKLFRDTYLLDKETCDLDKICRKIH